MFEYLKDLLFGTPVSDEHTIVINKIIAETDNNKVRWVNENPIIPMDRSLEIARSNVYSTFSYTSHTTIAFAICRFGKYILLIRPDVENIESRSIPFTEVHAPYPLLRTLYKSIKLAEKRLEKLSCDAAVHQFLTNIEETNYEMMDTKTKAEELEMLQNKIFNK